MEKTNQSVLWLSLIMLCLTLACSLKEEPQKCYQPSISFSSFNIKENESQCPENSFCNSNNFCACKKGYFGNCQNVGEYIDGTSKEFNISENFSYFLIEPTVNQFVNFQFILCNNQSIDNNELLNLWVDDGNLVEPTSQNALGTDKYIRVQQGCIALITSYFTFERQPNGQKQTLILGLRLQNPGTAKIQLIVQQLYIFGFDVIFRIILILVGGIVLISIGGLIYCMYKCRRRRRNGLNEQKLDISFFDQHMPVKKANLREIKEEICSVCLGEFKQNEDIRPTICGHIFHKACLDEWCVTNLSCPICRTSFQKQSLVHQQYLLSRRNSNSTQQNESIGDGIINGQNNLREPIV